MDVVAHHFRNGAWSFQSGAFSDAGWAAEIAYNIRTGALDPTVMVNNWGCRSASTVAALSAYGIGSTGFSGLLWIGTIGAERGHGPARPRRFGHESRILQVAMVAAVSFLLCLHRLARGKRLPKARAELSNNNRITQQMSGPLEKFLNNNKLMFSDPDTFERAMQTWDSRLKWAKRNIADLKQVCLALDSKRDLRLVLVSYEQISMVLKPAEALQGKVYISLMDMHYRSQTEIQKMPCAGEACEQWYVSTPRRQADPYPVLASKGDAISVVRPAERTLCFRLEFIYDKQPLPG